MRYIGILCINQTAALAIACRYPHFVGPEIGDEDSSLYYWHYHVNRHNHFHIWYYN